MESHEILANASGSGMLDDTATSGPFLYGTYMYKVRLRGPGLWNEG